MKISVINPMFYTVRNNVMLGTSLELRDENQVEELIRKILLENSIIAERIEIDMEKLKDNNFFKSAQDFLEEV